MDKDTKIKALARYLDVDPETIEADIDDLYITDSGEEYFVLTEEEADDKAKDFVKMTIDDVGVVDGSTSNFLDYCLRNCTDKEKVDDFIDQEIEYFTKQEPDPEHVDYLNSLSDYERICYIRDMLGDKEIEEFLDIDAIAEQAIDLDGRGHFIAVYDFKEIDLDDNLYAYRFN